MSRYVFKLPDIGEGVARAEIVAWHVDPGQAVEEDQPLVDVMTDKATVQIGAPASGRILSRKGEAGALVAIGEEIVVIDTGGDEEEAPPPPPAAAGAQAQGAEEAPALQAEAASQESTSSPFAGTLEAPRGKALAAPAVRRRAANLGLDIARMEGTGPGGRVLHEDLDRALMGPRPRDGAPATVASNAVEEIRLTGLRRQIAERMLESKRHIPHFSYVEEVDVTALEKLRADINGAADEGRPRLTILPFVIRAVVRAVAAHPALNAHFDAQAALIRRFGAVHAGVATQTPRGLVVPVIRNAQDRDLWSIASEIARLSEAARAGKATRAELTGSTITVSSLGALGGIAATPIIKPPEVAIIGVNRIVERPVIRDSQVVAGKLMNLSSSFDHRIVDGFEAAAFIQDVKAQLEAPGRLLLS